MSVELKTNVLNEVDLVDLLQSMYGEGCVANGIIVIITGPESNRLRCFFGPPPRPTST